MEIEHIRSVGRGAEEGWVGPALDDGAVPADSDSIENRIRGELICREWAVRRVHDGLVTFPNQIAGEAEDLGLHSASFGSEVRHDMMDLHDRPRFGGSGVPRRSRYESSRRGSIAFQVDWLSNALRPRAPIAAPSAGESMSDSSARFNPSRSPYRTTRPHPTSRTMSAAAVPSETKTGFENIIASKSLLGAANRLFGTDGSYSAATAWQLAVRSSTSW